MSAMSLNQLISISSYDRLALDQFSMSGYDRLALDQFSMSGYDRLALDQFSMSGYDLLALDQFQIKDCKLSLSQFRYRLVLDPINHFRIKILFTIMCHNILFNNFQFEII